MANFNKNTPEYKIFHQYQSDICNGLSRLPDSITPLAQSLCSAGIIMPSTMTGLSAPGLTPFDRANRVMTAAGTSIEQDVSNFEIVLEKLDDQGLSGLVDNMYGSLDEKKGIRKRRRRPNCRRRPSSRESSRPRYDLRPRTLKIKQQMKILVVGHNGSGKSSLINEIVGKDIATVGGSAQETNHNALVKYRCKVGEVDVTIYDTRGLGDSSLTDKGTMDEIVDGIESIDIVLICHKLYDRVDGIAKKEMEVLVEKMDDDLIDLSILVFTFGDDYLSRSCDPVFDDDGKLTDESKQEIKEHMETQQYAIEDLFKDAMKKNGISKEHADQVPSCITCGKRNCYGEQKELPTSDNWVDELWDLFQERCKPEARPILHSLKSTILRAVKNFFWRR